MNPALRIYIADDEDDARFMLSRTLDKAGLGRPTAIFTDGEEFLHFWDDNPPCGPALLLLDLNMPRLNGFDVLFALQRRPSAEMLRTIVVSTSEEEADITRAARLGANGYLTKFPAPGILAKVANEALRTLCRPSAG